MTAAARLIPGGRLADRTAAFVGLGAVLLCFALAQIILGPVRLSLGDIAGVLAGEADQMAHAIIAQIRAPRLVLGLLVGAGLALSGCALQGVLRNPLADPGLIGVTAGASVGAVAAIVLGGTVASELPAPLRPYLLPIAAFIGAGIVTFFVFAVARTTNGTSVATLILAGVAVNAIAFAMIGAMVYISDDRQLRDLTFWTMGSLGGSNWTLVLITGSVAVAASLVLARMGRVLDLFQIGERAAFHAGLDVEAAKLRVAVCSAAAVGAITAAAGPIGFIGLVAPHMARLIIGPSHRFVLPAAVLIGATLALASDLCVRTLVPPAEPPIGLATSLIGGPFFLWLLIRMKGELHA